MLAALRECHAKIDAQISRVIIGQEGIRELLLTACFAGGHCLVEGMPGLAKTSLVNVLSAALDLSFKRIQFTPDLMPSDVVGSKAFSPDRQWAFVPGPICANLVLADEINRATPKTQSALLEAMQEGKISFEGFQHVLHQPFLVLATQNPLDLEGTYPLPEAQLDRFMFCLKIDYPSYDEEVAVVMMSGSERPTVDVVMSRVDMLRFQ
jgi:MoxR-like ATPase